MEAENKILPDGSMNEVERIGDTVHRKINGPPMFHSYLLYLEQIGMPGVPRLLGIDGYGREILTFLPGKTMGPDYPSDHPCLHSDEAICDMAKFMRKLHDISVGFVPVALENGWKNPFFPDGPYETICHGDAAIWNFVFVDDKLAGLFDFDQSCPGTRAWDLTSTVFSAVGLVPYDYEPSLHAAQRKRQVKLFFDAYGMDVPADIMEMTADRIQRDACDCMTQGVAAGDERRVKMVEDGALVHYQKVVAHLKAHGHEWI